MKHLLIKSRAFEYAELSFKQWLDILGYAPTTVYNLPTHIREFFYYLEQNDLTKLQEIDVHIIREYYQQLKHRSNQKQGGGLSNASLNKHLQALYKFTDYLRQSGKMTLPKLGIDLEPSDTSSIEVLSKEDITELYKMTHVNADNPRLAPLIARDKAILTIFYGCGLRRNEGYHLNVTDINFDRRIVHVRKGKGYKERFVPFSKQSSQYLQEYVYDARPLLLKGISDAFFISQRGKRMQGQSMSLRLKILQMRSNDIYLQQKNVRLHVLRHSIATHLLQNGMPLESISKFLGHSSLESTQVYTHLVESLDKQ